MGMKTLFLGIISQIRGYGVDENTKLLLHCNGADESTVFTDASPAQHGNATVEGTAQVDTDNKKWGTGSLLLDGDSDYLTYDDSPDWDIFGNNSDDWTIDLWVRHTDYSGVEEYITQFESGLAFWHFFHQAGTGIRLVFSNISVDLSGGIITDSNWHHIALVKKANEYGLYLDGTQTAYTTSDSTLALTGLLYIGRYGTPSDHFNGHMDEIRIQHSNIFEANPVVGLTDEIDVPTKEYSE